MEAAEHGLGAGMPISRPSRVRPLKRREASLLVCEDAKQGGTAVNFIALGLSKGGFTFLGGNNYVRKVQG